MTGTAAATIAAPTFSGVLAKLDAVIRYPLASPTFLFALADALSEWSVEEAVAGNVCNAGEIAQRAVAAGDAATAASRRSEA